MNPQAKTHWARFFLPLVLHFCISALCGLVCQSIAGKGSGKSVSTIATGISSAICIPLFFHLYRAWFPPRQDSPSAPAHDDNGVKSAFCPRLMAQIAAFPCGIALSLLFGVFSDALHLDRVFSNAAQEELYSASLPAQLLVLVFLSPLCEELLFRALMFRQLRLTQSEMRSAVLVSAVFALYHGNPIQMIYAFPMGLLLQYFARQGGSLTAPILFHAGANAASVLVTYFLS